MRANRVQRAIVYRHYLLVSIFTITMTKKEDNGDRDIFWTLGGTEYTTLYELFQIFLKKYLYLS